MKTQKNNKEKDKKMKIKNNIENINKEKKDEINENNNININIHIDNENLNNNKKNIINDNKDDILNSIDMLIKNEGNKLKEIEIIENYFDFHMHDIELAQIERYYNSYNKLKPEEINIIKIMIKKYKTFIAGNLNQTIYPYLSNSIRTQFQALNNDASKKFFLLEILSERNEIKKELFNFFKDLTKVNLYGISPNIKKTFNQSVLDSEDFLKFTEKLSKWHCHVEMIVLYLELLSDLYNEKFDFKKHNFSLDKNFQNNTDIYIKKNFYKLASTLCSKIVLSPGIDYQKLLTFALTSVTAGINLGGLAVILPQQQIAKAIGIFGLNFLAGRLSTEFGSASNFVEFEILTKLVNKLNKCLVNIEKLCYKLIVLEMQEEINIDLETSKIDIIKIKKKEISDLLENYLKEVDYSFDIEQKIKEEYVELNSCITEEKLCDDWVIEHLSIKEKGENQKEIKSKNKEKEKKKDKDKNKNDKKDKKGIFDDFVDISKEDDF